MPCVSRAYKNHIGFAGISDSTLHPFTQMNWFFSGSRKSAYLLIKEEEDIPKIFVFWMDNSQ
jgi:hypothetical protein